MLTLMPVWIRVRYYSLRKHVSKMASKQSNQNQKDVLAVILAHSYNKIYILVVWGIIKISSAR